MTIQEIKDWVGNYKHIYITGHVHPDGDCIGAALGLKGLLAQEGIGADLLLENPPELYSFLQGYHEIIQVNPEQVDVLFVVDCNAKSRFTPFLEAYDKAKVVINIDHHEAPNEYITDKYWIWPEASSTSEMIYHLFPKDRQISKEVADALYTGLVFDTGGFVHSNTKESTLLAAAHLMRLGADFNFIMKRLLYRQTYNKLVAKRIALENFRFLADNKIALTVLTNDEMVENHLSKEDTEDVVHMLAQLEDIEAAVFVAEFTKGDYKLSFRSKKDLDVCLVAKAFNGGGHKKAAGATSHLGLKDLLNKIEEEIRANLSRGQ